MKPFEAPIAWGIMVQEAFEQVVELAVQCWPGVLAGAIGGYVGATSAGVYGFFVGTTVSAAVAMFAWSVRRKSGLAARTLDVVLGTIGSVVVVTAIAAAIMFKSWIGAAIVAVLFLLLVVAVLGG